VAAMSESSTETSAPATSNVSTGWIADAFSFPVMCMFLLAAVIFQISVKQIGDPDIWWHLRNAAYLLQQHSFPAIDMYSFGATGSPWLNFEWLSELPFFLSFKAMGQRGMLLLFFVLLVLIYAGVYYRSCRAGADCKNATLTTLLAVALATVSIGPRTLLFGWLCMVTLLIVLDHFQRTGQGQWFLPPLFALWINLHGSWVFGVIVLVIFIASGLVEGEWALVVARKWTPNELKKLLLASAISLAALFVNPFGYKLLLYPLDLVFRQASAVKYVQEWHSVDFSTGRGKLAMLVFFGLLVATLFSRRKWKLDEVLLMAFALWAGFSHVRLLFFTGLIVAPILAPRLQLFPPYERELDKPWLNAVIMAAVVGWVIFAFPSAVNLQEQINEQFPVAALQFMKDHDLTGRIFNQYGWGGYMEWNTPASKPFIDGRADIFVYNGTLAEYASAVTLQAPFKVLDKYNFDYVLLPPDEPLAYLLTHSSAWHPIYSDQVAVLLQRNPPAASMPAMNE
jgi:hypothetical protein